MPIHEATEEEIDFASKVLMDKILEFRREVDITPIKCEPLSLNEAAELCNVGVTGNMVSGLLALQEQADLKGAQDFLEKHFAKIVVLLIVLMVPLVYYLIVNNT